MATRASAIWWRPRRRPVRRRTPGRGRLRQGRSDEAWGTYESPQGVRGISPLTTPDRAAYSPEFKTRARLQDCGFLADPGEIAGINDVDHMGSRAHGDGAWVAAGPGQLVPTTSLWLPSGSMVRTRSHWVNSTSGVADRLHRGGRRLCSGHPAEDMGRMELGEEHDHQRRPAGREAPSGRVAILSAGFGLALLAGAIERGSHRHRLAPPGPFLGLDEADAEWTFGCRVPGETGQASLPSGPTGRRGNLAAWCASRFSAEPQYSGIRTPAAPKWPREG